MKGGTFKKETCQSRRLLTDCRSNSDEESEHNSEQVPFGILLSDNSRFIVPQKILIRNKDDFNKERRFIDVGIESSWKHLVSPQIWLQ